jgi:UDP-glucose 4-epimerase
MMHLPIVIGGEGYICSHMVKQLFGQLSCAVNTPALLVADTTLARKQLGWQPQYADLATIIEHAWKWETR